MSVSSGLVSHNKVSNITGIGVQIENGFGVIIDGNTVHDCVTGLAAINYGRPIALIEYRKTKTNSIFMNNLVYNTSISGIITMSSPGNFIYNNTVNNNTGGFSGIYLANQGTTFNSDNCSVNNNIVTYTNCAIAIDGNTIGTILDHNIYYNDSGNTITHKWNGNYTLGQFQSRFGLEANSSYIDPLYIGILASNFNIQNNSPAVDAGITLQKVLFDIEGTPRPQGAAYDIGAYEFTTTGLPPPTVSITSPTNNAPVSGVVTVSASASDLVGTARLEFYVNGALQATITTPPYLFAWDTSPLASGAYTLSAKAYDAAGNMGQSSDVVVTVTGDSISPSVSLTQPANNALVSGIVPVTAQASDNIGVTKIEIYANGVLALVSNLNPVTYYWDTSQATIGSNTLYARAYDTANNMGQSDNVIVTVVKEPGANFSATPLSGPAPLSVTFTDSSTGSITGWQWDFGDTATSTLQNPVHVYAAAGSYTVKLSVTGPGGSNAKTQTDYITVNTAVAPVANFSAIPLSGAAPLSVTFTDSSTGSITGWQWDFGDTATSTLQNPVHVYAAAGSYTVMLTLTGPGGSNTKVQTSYITVNPAAAPVANFSAAPLSGAAPLSVTFTDSSTGSITGWQWDFGDTATSTLQNPVHVYAAAGSYTVMLTLTGPGGSNTKVQTSYITVNPAAAPVANFSATPLSGAAPLSVTFTDSSTGSITGWQWDFGDTATSTLQNPVHVYAAAGSYTVMLTLTGPGGSNTKVQTSYITVNPAASPVANFSATPLSGAAPLSVTFTDSSTGSITGWQWDFGDTATSTLQNPMHVYAAAGSYTVTLTLTGPSGSNTKTQAGYITVNPAAPVANFSATPLSGAAPLSVTFTDSSTGSITGWQWDFGDTATSTLQNPVHVYAAAGSYTVKLSVTGPGGSNTKTQTGYITVNPAAPVANFSATPLSGAAPLSVTFTDSSTGSITGWQWDFGDTATSTLQNPVHVYAAAGSYTVKLSVTGPGGSNIKTQTSYITVNPAAPVANFSAAPLSGAAPLSVTFTDSSTGSITGWQWDFGDTVTSTLQNPVHIYAAAASYTVKLTVTGPGGANTKTQTSYITVNPAAPVANFSATPLTGAAPLSVTLTDSSTGSITSWQWDFGDTATSALKNPVHVYATAGSYTVKLTVTGPGGSNTKTLTNYIVVTSATSTWVSRDVGNVGATGTDSFSNGVFSISGSGTDIWGTADAFRYVYQPLTGDGQIIARVSALQNTDPWAKGGVMIRETLVVNSAQALMAISSSSGAAFQRRLTTGGATVNSAGPNVRAPYWVKLTRSGKTFSGYVSPDGVTWTLVGSDTITMASTVYLGLAVTSHKYGTLCNATLDGVSVTAPTITPTVGITSPANGAGFSAPATVAITVSATAGTGATVSKVEYYSGTTLIGTATASPYNFTWSGVAAGNYSLTAKVTDSLGATASSSPVGITVTSTISPTVSITAPANGAAFNAPATIAFTVTAKAGSGATVSKVEYYNGTTLIGTATVSPYNFTWSGVAAGSYSLTAKITDSLGATASSSPVGITVTSGGLPTPWATQDIGSVGAAGSASYQSSTFSVIGSGTDIWGTADAFRYVYKPLTGDGQIIARVASLQNTNTWAKGGVMIRATLAANSAHALMAISASSGAAFQRRLTTGGSSVSSTGPNVKAPYWVRLVRRGNTFTGSVSTDGVTWTQVGSDTITMATTVYLGLAVTSHNYATLCTATLDGVQ